MIRFRFCPGYFVEPGRTCPEVQPIQWTLDPDPVRPHRNVKIDLRRRDILVPQQFLDRSQIDSILQQVGREGMPQSMTRHSLLDSGRPRRPLDRLIVNRPMEMMASSQAALWIR